MTQVPKYWFHTSNASNYNRLALDVLRPQNGHQNGHKNNQWQIASSRADILCISGTIYIIMC